MSNDTKLAFTKDNPVMILAVLSGVLAFVNVVMVLVRLRSHDFKVPVQYIVNDGSVLQTSSWYTLYSLLLFSLLGTGVVIFLAHRLHKSNKFFAVGILAVQVIIGITSLLATGALLGLVSKV